MKYREHSLRYVPRQNPKPQPRSTVVPPKEIETDAVFAHRHNHTEPLFNVHDVPSKLDNVKETFGTLGHIMRDKVVPHASYHVQNTSKKIIPRVKDTARTIPVKNISKINRNLVTRVIIVTIIFAGGFFLAQRMQAPSANTTNANQTGNTTAPIGGTSPNYKTLLPKGKTIEQLGGWNRISPNDRNPVFAYVDTLERVQISVSQQPMPADFSSDPDKDIKNLALGFNAKERVVADDATVYFVGTSTKGPQSVILAKEQVLILIKAPAQLKNEVWSAYIAELQ